MQTSASCGGAYFCMGTYKHDVVVVIKMGTHIYGCLFSMGAYYADSPFNHQNAIDANKPHRCA